MTAALDYYDLFMSATYLSFWSTRSAASLCRSSNTLVAHQASVEALLSRNTLLLLVACTFPTTLMILTTRSV